MILFISFLDPDVVIAGSRHGSFLHEFFILTCLFSVMSLQPLL